MRLDIERRRIEYSSTINLEDEPSTTQKIQASTTEVIELMVVDHEYTRKEKIAWKETMKQTIQLIFCEWYNDLFIIKLKGIWHEFFIS